MQPTPDGLEPVIAFVGTFVLAMLGPLLPAVVLVLLVVWRRRPGRLYPAAAAAGLADGALALATGTLPGLPAAAVVLSHILAGLGLAVGGLIVWDIATASLVRARRLWAWLMVDDVDPAAPGGAATPVRSGSGPAPAGPTPADPDGRGPVI